MKKKTVFIAHPIKGNVRGNTRKVLNICKMVHNKGVIPIAPYLVLLMYLNDEVATERELGIKANLETFKRGYVDELWLFGDRISSGMAQEVKFALKLGIPIVPQTEGTKKDLNKFAK